MDKAQISEKIHRLTESMPQSITSSLKQQPNEVKSLSINTKEIAGMIDHTLLNANCSRQQILQLCKEATKYSFFSVCIPSCFLEFAKQQLLGSSVKLCTVIGFPLGNSSPEAKTDEAKKVLFLGADEVDMVQNNSFLFSKNYEEMFLEIKRIKSLMPNKTLKVILETHLLSDEQIVLSSLIAKAAGADFVKTSTGFAGGGARAEDIFIMRTCVGNDLGVKASGGIKNMKQALDLIHSGANRLGCSSSVAIINQQTVKEAY